MSQVSSRGCSRAYILCVLFRALMYVRRRRMASHPVTFPFNCEEIEKWLVDSKEDCSDLGFQRRYGGTDLNLSDPSTFWTSSTHFFTWWKNNIERKSKFLSLLQDSCYSGDDEKGLSRAMFCKQAIALSINIKNHFERVLNQQLDRRILVQVTPPYRMPAHLEKWFSTVSSCHQCDECNSPMVDDPESIATVGICSKCVHFLEYNEYARSVILSRSGRAHRKRSESSTNSGMGRQWVRSKKARVVDDGYVPSASTTRSISRKISSTGGARNGLRASTRVSYRPVAPGNLSDPFSAGSALALLQMKRDDVTIQRLVNSDNSTEGEDSRSGSAHGHNDTDTEDARHRDMDFEEHYESQYMFDGAFLQRISTPDLFRCYLGGDAVEDSIVTSSSTSGLTISTMEETRGEEHEGENCVPAVTMEDGHSLHDFLVSCYRDGIYPSPGYSAAQQCGPHFFSGDSDEQQPVVCSLKNTGTETDSCHTNILRDQLIDECSFRLPELSDAAGLTENGTEEARATAGIAEEDLLILSNILH